MKRIPAHRILLAVLLLTAWLGACDRDETDWTPAVEFSAKPDSGNTTHTFSFEARIINAPKGREAFFVRWDWNGDSVWDTRFSSETRASHRYYTPGSHRIRTELLTQDGQRVVLAKDLKVNQGYSAPHPALTVNPPMGNFTLMYTFDAGSSYDDEDSSRTLTYRWDWDNDGIFDTERLTDPVIRKKFSSARTYNVKLEVTDPTFRHATIINPLIINNIDTLIRVNFDWSSKNGTVKDTFFFDASATRDSLNPDRIFTYAWDIKNEVTYGPFETPDFPHVFWTRGAQEVTLTVRDNSGLQNSRMQEIYVFDENKPPRPGINLSTPFGNITTQFYIDAWASMDDRTPPSELLIRWDFEGDGVWDTQWSYDKFLFHQYNYPGTFNLTLEAEDPGGERAVVTRKVKVSENPAETSYIQDRRNEKYYGTVKIGDQWWMSDNLDYRSNPKMDIPMLQICWGENSGGCDRFGALYQGARAIDFNSTGQRICPTGWRLPTRADWEEMGRHVPATGAREAMEVGGKMGFNAQYFGYGDYTFVYDLFGNIADTLYKFYRYSEEVRFLSITKRPFFEVSRMQFYFGLTRNYDGIDLLWGDFEGYYYVRCIKED